VVYVATENNTVYALDAARAPWLLARRIWVRPFRSRHCLGNAAITPPLSVSTGRRSSTFSEDTYVDRIYLCEQHTETLSARTQH